MSACVTVRHNTWAGLPVIELTLPTGERLVVAQQGAHVLSWVSGGQERLYLSPRSVMDGQTAIRGGVPVCFPQFNQRGPLAERLPKHGFARNVAWQADVPELAADHARLTLRLSDSAQTRAWLPQAFALALSIDLSPGALQLTFDVHNTDTQALAFTGALHTYLAVPDAAQASLQGLGGQTEWDSLTHTQAVAPDTLRFSAAFDRVYTASEGPLTLSQTMSIQQSPSWRNTVVWNPAQELCQCLPDMPSDGWRHMLCVEAAQVDAPITLPAGGRWNGWQRLQVLNP